MTLKHSDISVVTDVLNAAKIEIFSENYRNFIFFLELIMIRRDGIKPTKEQRAEKNYISNKKGQFICYKLPNGKWHREDGPARFWENEENKGYYYLNNIRYEKELFDKIIQYLDKNI